jgi:hypothetical protein
MISVAIDPFFVGATLRSGRWFGVALHYLGGGIRAQILAPCQGF